MGSYYDYIGKAKLASAVEQLPPSIKGKVNIDVVENDHQPGMVYLMIYAHDLALMSDHETSLLAEWLKRTLDNLNESLSIGKYTYHVTDQTPGEWRAKKEDH